MVFVHGDYLCGMVIGDRRYLNPPVELPDTLAVVLGSVLVLAGSVVLFAANPIASVGPLFDVSSVEPVSVIANMAVGLLSMAAGVSVAAPGFDRVLWAEDPEREVEL